MPNGEKERKQAGKPKKIQFGLAAAKLILERFSVPVIRHMSIANLDRWKSKDSWCSAFDEWRFLMIAGSDKQIIEVMTGEDENSIRLRSSAPYTGMLDQAVVHQLKKEIFGIDLSIFDETREEWLRQDAEYEAKLREARQ
jgi:hypothetical protein